MMAYRESTDISAPRTRDLWLASGAISSIAVAIHVAALSWEYLGETQLERHEAVINGAAGDPWQYRVLSEYLVRLVIVVFGMLGLPNYESWAFVMFRWAQCLVVCLLAHRWYVRLGYTYGTSMIGIGLAGFVFSAATFDSDLSFNTYMDLIFSLLVLLLVIEGRHVGWLVALVPFAVLNRETALLIPIAAVVVGGRRVWRAALVALILGLIAYGSIRWFLGERPLITAYGSSPGLEILRFNVRLETIRQLSVTCGLLAVLAVVGWRWAGQIERRLLIQFGSLWFVVHAAVGILAETRLLLVPIVVALIPVSMSTVSAYMPDSSTRLTGY